MTTESQNPYQSPTAVDQPNEVVELPGVVTAIGLATGLGLSGAGALAIPVLFTWLLTEEITVDGLWGLLGFSMVIGWPFATSEILRITLTQGRFETANRVLVSGGILFGAFIGVLWFHDCLLPGLFPTGPPDHSQPGFWIIALVTVAIHITLLFALRATFKWSLETRPETARADSPQELIDGN